MFQLNSLSYIYRSLEPILPYIIATYDEQYSSPYALTLVFFSLPALVPQ